MMGFGCPEAEAEFLEFALGTAERFGEACSCQQSEQVSLGSLGTPRGPRFARPVIDRTRDSQSVGQNFALSTPAPVASGVQIGEQE